MLYLGEDDPGEDNNCGPTLAQRSRSDRAGLRGAQNGPANKETALAALEHALNHSATTVRVGTTVSLVSISPTGDEGVQFEEAKKLFRARANLNSDNADQSPRRRKIYLLTGDPIEAIGALQASLEIDPESPQNTTSPTPKPQPS